MIMVMATSVSFAQVSDTKQTLDPRFENLSGLSAWFESLDNFLADALVDGKPEAVYNTWQRWQPSSKLSLLAKPGLPVADSVSPPSAATEADVRKSLSTALNLEFISAAASALDDLVILSSGVFLDSDQVTVISRLRKFVYTSEAFLALFPTDTLNQFATFHRGANPVRV